MLRKVGVIFVAVFLRSLGTRIQAFALFLLLLAFLALTHRHRPFRTRQLNQLELLSLIASAATVYAGFFYLSARSPTDPAFDLNKDFTLPPVARWLLFIFIVSMNIWFLVYWFSMASSSLRTACRNKCKGLYLACCLC